MRNSPRLLAYEVLAEVRDADAYANLVLPARLREADLSQADRAFATELVYGTLRMQGYYDRVLELAAARPVDVFDPVALVVLRLGAHQLLGMRVADHAAVHATVEVQKRVGRASAVGFVNGVLRALGRSTPDEWRAAVLAAAQHEDEALAAEFSHPEWIIRAFRAGLRAEGRETELAELLAAENAAPAVNVAVLPGAEPDRVRRALTAASGEEVPDQNGISPIGFVLDRGDPAVVTGPANGWIRVQDQGSQLAALILSRSREINPGERWLDLCAGPGGKTAVLAAEARLAGASVLANEAVPARANLVRRSVIAVQDVVEVVVGDGRDIAHLPQAAGGFDRVLVDAPCTGLGALRRRPEARWRKRPSDVAPLTALQSQLLEAAIGVLKPGGVIAYVTCSPHRAETRKVVNAALKAHPELVEQSARAVAASLAPTGVDTGDGEERSLQLWPHRHGTDAMFVALLAKRS